MTRKALAVVLCTFLAGSAVGCDMLEIGVKSKVAEGQLYSSGEGRFDLYFQKVHAEQVAAKSWDADKKGARKPLASYVGVGEAQSNAALFDAVKAKAQGGPYKLEVEGGSPKVVVPPKGDAGLARAAEESVRMHLAHAKRVKETGAKADDLAREGEGLEPSVKQRYAATGGDKEREVKRELKAAVVAMRHVARDAKHEDSDVEDFVKGLADALGAPAPKAAGSAAAPPKSTGAGKPTPKPTSTGTGAAPPKTAEPLPPPKPPVSGNPPTKPPDDDFNP